MVDSNVIEPGIKTASHSSINQVIGVMSAKGGVGKSFISGLLASGLARMGYRVGLLDADLTGSCIPMLFGLRGSVKPGKYSFVPLDSRSGIKVISMNLLFKNEDQLVIWKESFTGKVVEELYREVEWGELDFLLVDMPPATSEVAVTIMQTLPFKGAIIVTTPQVLSTKIVNRAALTAQNCGVHILGVVENMAYYRDPDTKTRQYIFGHFNDDSVAQTAKAPVLTQLPFDPSVINLCDAGKIEEAMLEESAALAHAFLASCAATEQINASAAKDVPGKAAESAGAQELQSQEVDRTETQLPPPEASKAFSDIVSCLIRNKENVGVLDPPDARGYYLGRCGDRMQIDLQIVLGRIIQAKFLADGCGATQACGSMITKMACSRTLDQAMKISPEELLTVVGGLPQDHEHCAELAVMTLREAIIDAIEGHG